MENKYKILFIALFFIILILAFFFNHKPAFAPAIVERQTENIKFSNGAMINVEVADTPAEREKGLSGRQSLTEGSGMLFVFTAADNYSFWMKDMNFGLDFIWIKGNIVMDITENVMPVYGKSPNVFKPSEKVDKVLEVNAGTAARLGIKVGDKAEFKILN